MEKNPAQFAQQNTEHAMQAANFGMNWFREIAEQNLSQSQFAIAGAFKLARKVVDDLDSQGSALCRHSMSLTETALSNALDLGHKFLQAKEPHEFAQIQTEFLSRQAEAIAEETKQLGQTLVNGAEELANIGLRRAEELTSTQSKAA